MIRKRYWLDATVGLGITAVLGVLLGGGPGFPGWVFSPYFLLVVWMAVTHGWLEGLLTVAMAALTGVPGPSLVWLAASALYTGALAEANRRRIHRLRGTVADQAERLVQGDEEQGILKKAFEELQNRLSDEQNARATLYDAYRRLTRPELTALPAEVVDVVADALHADQCSFYFLEGTQLRLEVQRGWPAVPEEARVMELGDDLLSLAAHRKRLETIRDFPIDRLTTSTGPGLLRLMAAPVLDPASGACLGVISVEGLPYSNFTRATARLLETIAELAGQTLAAGRGSRALDGDWLGSEQFRRRLRDELLARQKGTRPAFTVATFQFLGMDRLKSDLVRWTERSIELIMAAHLRDEELRGRSEHATLAVILSEPESETSETILRELGDDLDRFLGTWFPELGSMRWELGSCPSDGLDSPEEALARSRTQMRPRTLSGQPPNPHFEDSEEELQRLLGHEPVAFVVRHAFIRHCIQSGHAEGLRQAGQQFSLLRLLARS